MKNLLVTLYYGNMEKAVQGTGKQKKEETRRGGSEQTDAVTLSAQPSLAPGHLLRVG